MNDTPFEEFAMNHELHQHCADCKGCILDPLVQKVAGVLCIGCRAKRRTVASMSDTPVEEKRNCNMHLDCDAADDRAKAKGFIRADHCHDECCEDCFGA